MNHRIRQALGLGLALGMMAPGLAVGDDALEALLPPPAERTVDFERDIQPILAQNCVACHGPQQRKAGLRLDRKDDVFLGGDSGPPFEPGHSVESLLIEYVAAIDPDWVMPPEGEGERLTDEQVGLLRAWIDQGAAWPDGLEIALDDDGDAGHWAFRKPERPEVPEVNDPSWPRNAIDHFVLARLDAEGLKPSPEADRETLIRRLSLDLTGLPPTIEDVEAFVQDERPNAYDLLVDRLLASPHYGERWARFWLDRARYADTNGYEKDRERSIWPYRDWVIRAFNDDKPFDQFTVEQIAGDMLPNPSPDQLVATGFHRNTMINEEGGIDVEEFRYESIVDRVATTGTVWLGLTVACAQCHTHKYDPITQREYYQFFAFFNNADEPEIDLPDPVIAARRHKVEAQIAAIEDELENRFPLPDDMADADACACGEACDSSAEQLRREHLASKMAEWEHGLTPHRWTVLEPSRLVSQKNATMTVLDDRSVLVSGDWPNNDTYVVELPLPDDLHGVTALRLEALPHESLPDGGPGRAPLFSVGDFILTEVELTVASGDGAERPIALQNASESHSEKGKPAALAIDGIPDTGWTIKGGVGQPQAAVFELAEPVDGGPDTRLVLVLDQFGIHQMTLGRFRVSVTTDPHPVRALGVPAEIEEILLVAADARTDDQARQLKRHYLSVAPELAEVHEEIAKLRQTMPKFSTSMIMRERDPEHARTTHIHNRGEYLQPTEPVEPGVPSVLHDLPEDAPRDRLTLARWLVSEANPLVGRVVMNQIWQMYFGRGLVETPEDFGLRSPPPSHPELLDWLATEFVARGWSLKAMHRLIVTSATYRQSSKVTPELLARDPKNELLARGPRFRVQAEVVRDIALTASGLLNPAIGGPSVYPPQPEGVTALAYGQTAWPTSDGPDRYRRGLYTFTKRTAPFATFTTFDMPTSETFCVRRERSNTPLQALTLLNDTVFVEASQAMARRLLAEATGDSDERLGHLFRLCLTRSPQPEERAMLTAFFQRQLDRFQRGEADPFAVAGLDPENVSEGLDVAEAAAWTTVARALLNLDETITKE